MSEGTSPVTVAVDETKDAQGRLDGYYLFVNIPVPLPYRTAEDGSLKVIGTPKGKRPLKMGPAKLKQRILKEALGKVKAMKQFWVERYKELKGMIQAGAPPKKVKAAKKD